MPLPRLQLGRFVGGDGLGVVVATHEGPPEVVGPQQGLDVGLRPAVVEDALVVAHVGIGLDQHEDQEGVVGQGPQLAVVHGLGQHAVVVGESELGNALAAVHVSVGVVVEDLELVGDQEVGFVADQLADQLVGLPVKLVPQVVLVVKLELGVGSQHDRGGVEELIVGKHVLDVVWVVAKVLLPLLEGPVQVTDLAQVEAGGVLVVGNLGGLPHPSCRPKHIVESRILLVNDFGGIAVTVKGQVDGSLGILVGLPSILSVQDRRLGLPVEVIHGSTGKSGRRLGGYIHTPALQGLKINRSQVPHILGPAPGDKTRLAGSGSHLGNDGVQILVGVDVDHGLLEVVQVPL